MPRQTSSPVVSVAMITYNHARFVQDAVRSVLDQRTDFPFEIVIGDDASTDGTSDCINAFKREAPNVIRAISRPTNVGMHDNLDGVLRSCRGQFIAFLEGDDYWTSVHKLQWQVDLLKTADHAIGVCHAVKLVDPFSEDTGVVFPAASPREITTKDLLQENIIATASAMIRKSALPILAQNVRGLKMRDWPIWVLGSLRGPWIYSPEIFAAYRIHSTSCWSSLAQDQKMEHSIEAFDWFSTELPSQFAAIARERASEWRLMLLEQALLRGEQWKARQRLREVIRNIGSYGGLPDAKRFGSASWQTLSPRTHDFAKRLLRSTGYFCRT